jgi:hypothetical protein
MCNPKERIGRMRLLILANFLRNVPSQALNALVLAERMKAGKGI